MTKFYKTHLIKTTLQCLLKFQNSFDEFKITTIIKAQFYSDNFYQLPYTTSLKLYLIYLIMTLP